jgi:hypothetical protein
LKLSATVATRALNTEASAIIRFHDLPGKNEPRLFFKQGLFVRNFFSAVRSGSTIFHSYLPLSVLTR